MAGALFGSKEIRRTLSSSKRRRVNVRFASGKVNGMNRKWSLDFENQNRGTLPFLVNSGQ